MGEKVARRYEVDSTGGCKTPGVGPARDLEETRRKKKPKKKIQLAPKGRHAQEG